MLHLKATKTADFGAEYSRSTFIGECDARGIPLERKENGDVKSSVTIPIMKERLAAYHEGDQIIPRKTVNGEAPGTRFLGTKQWDVPTLPAAATTKQSELNPQKRCQPSAHVSSKKENAKMRILDRTKAWNKVLTIRSKPKPRKQQSSIAALKNK